MSILLSEMVSELEDEVPAKNNVPTALQYENAVKDAVRDFSERCGLAQIATLNIVPGTATYDLAADFLSMIYLESFATADGVLISSAGIIPIDSDWSETNTIRNGQITFDPVPTYTMARDYKYKAAWIGTVTDDEYADTEYATMNEREKRIILLKAKSIAFGKMANALASAGGMKYSLGAVSVDKGSGTESLTKEAFVMHGEYVQACEKYNGAVIF